MPFGKHRGAPVSEVLGQDPSHLAWFRDAVDGNEAIEGAIRALPGFCPIRRAPQVHKPDLPNMGVDPRLSREQLDRLCREILDPPK